MQQNELQQVVPFQKSPSSLRYFLPLNFTLIPYDQAVA